MPAGPSSVANLFPPPAGTPEPFDPRCIMEVARIVYTDHQRTLMTREQFIETFYFGDVTTPALDREHMDIMTEEATWAQIKHRVTQILQGIEG